MILLQSIFQMPNIKILYEDDDLLVVDKESGVVVNRSQTYNLVTLQDLLYKRSESSAPQNFGATPGTEPGNEYFLRAGIVHRLDKDTSGVLLVAKNEAAFENLQSQFKKRYVQKEYAAMIFGSLPQEIIEINAPIKRDPNNRMKYAVVAGGKESFTKLVRAKETVLNGQKMNLVNVFPKTGRTHQIRVHLSALNCPIVGDEIYSTRSQLRFSGEYFGRLMLHAKKISFMHPTTSKTMALEAPLPEIFLKYFS